MTGLPVKYVGALLGTGGIGKSYCLIAIATAVATAGATDELSILPGSVSPRRVLMLAAEEDQVMLHQRFYRVGQHIPQHARELLYENLLVLSTVGKTPQIVDRNGQRNERAVQEIISCAQGYGLVILDTSRQFHSGDENRSDHMTAFTSALTHIAVSIDAAVLFSHHIGKGALRNGTADAGDAGRGSMALHDNVKFQLNLSRPQLPLLRAYGLSEDDASWYAALDVSKVNFVRPMPTKLLRRRDDGTLHYDRTLDISAYKPSSHHRVETKNESAASAHESYEDEDLFGI